MKISIKCKSFFGIRSIIWIFLAHDKLTIYYNNIV